MLKKFFGSSTETELMRINNHNNQIPYSLRSRFSGADFNYKFSKFEGNTGTSAELQTALTAGATEHGGVAYTSNAQGLEHSARQRLPQVPSTEPHFEHVTRHLGRTWKSRAQ
jgi:hypothetical protein